MPYTLPAVRDCAAATVRSTASRGAGRFAEQIRQLFGLLRGRRGCDRDQPKSRRIPDSPGLELVVAARSKSTVQARLGAIVTRSTSILSEEKPRLIKSTLR